MFLVFGPPGMWDIAPQQEIEPTPALEGKVLTAGPPGKFPKGLLFRADGASPASPDPT